MASGWTGGDYPQRPFDDLLADVAGSDPAPAAGSVTAASLSLAAALTAKVARRSTRHISDAGRLAAAADSLRARAVPLISGDAAAYAAVLAAKRSGQTGAGQRQPAGGEAADGEAADGEAAAMAEAMRIPAEIAVTAADVVDLAGYLAARGNPNLLHDAIAAADLASQCSAVAASLARANALDPASGRDSARSDAADAAASAAERAASAAVAIER
ncbi:cyclodeaminase/cyclohydrolase family protein [Arthrobacter castelli]|uniref:cyclodeaminase/cyclohydrolase family protein n=1 Tax=Arthrobacter castelli TaxID=271431 RepID=UPI0003F604F8|nr:cyclodeaminase/cyclohydrolase family protein [Arthrobacter castelli]